MFFDSNLKLEGFFSVGPMDIQLTMVSVMDQWWHGLLTHMCITTPGTNLKQSVIFIRNIFGLRWESISRLCLLHHLILTSILRWVSARKTKLQCVSNGVTSFLHQPIDFICYTFYTISNSDSLRERNSMQLIVARRESGSVSLYLAIPYYIVNTHLICADGDNMPHPVAYFMLEMTAPQRWCGPVI